MSLKLKGRSPRFPDACVGYAIGDIHGRADLLELMLARIQSDRTARPRDAGIVVFLGDYVDRGPDSARVIEMLASLTIAGAELLFLKGNHEQAMLAFLDGPVENRAWLAHGGLDTMAAYGVHPLPPIGASDDAVGIAARRLRLALPRRHLEFLRGLERFVLLGDYAFVHAGIDWGRPVDEQRDEDLFWARRRFLADKRRSSHVIVHGHTIVAEPYRDERRIGLDIGAYATAKLCAARFEGEEVGFLTVHAGD
jgi:serine/threonine protein phosphatase 1